MVIPSFTRAQLAAGAPGPETALTIGVLDGVHLGHQALLSRLRDEARKRTLAPGVVTLHPHPITVLRPEIAPSYLTSLEDRMELLRAAGADGDGGQLILLILVYTVIAGMLVTVVVNVSKVYLVRRSLVAAADGAALTAATAAGHGHAQQDEQDR